MWANLGASYGVDDVPLDVVILHLKALFRSSQELLPDMSTWTRLTASDGHQLDAYVAQPSDEPKGAIVLVQEIFGINDHIRGVADGYAADGYTVIAPALFDRIQPGILLSYSDEDKKKAFALYPQLKPELSLLDIAAAFAHVKGMGKGTAALGFCYGGLMSWISATRGPQHGMQPACCIGYYPGGVGNVAGEQPSCPVQLHFGEADSHIGKDQVEAVRSAHPEVEIYMYEGAGHAFNREPDPSAYNADAAKLARERALVFLKEHVG
jgi:carboxymethylenebutenolidase